MFEGDGFERAGLDDPGHGDENVNGAQISFDVVHQALDRLGIANVADVVLDCAVFGQLVTSASELGVVSRCDGHGKTTVQEFAADEQTESSRSAGHECSLQCAYHGASLWEPTDHVRTSLTGNFR